MYKYTLRRQLFLSCISIVNGIGTSITINIVIRSMMKHNHFQKYYLKIKYSIQQLIRYVLPHIYSEIPLIHAFTKSVIHRFLVAIN